MRWLPLHLTLFISRKTYRSSLSSYCFELIKVVWICFALSLSLSSFPASRIYMFFFLRTSLASRQPNVLPFVHSIDLHCVLDVFKSCHTMCNIHSIWFMLREAFQEITIFFQILFTLSTNAQQTHTITISFSILVLFPIPLLCSFFNSIFFIYTYCLEKKSFPPHSTCLTNNISNEMSTIFSDLAVRFFFLLSNSPCVFLRFLRACVYRNYPYKFSFAFRHRLAIIYWSDWRRTWRRLLIRCKWIWHKITSAHKYQHRWQIEQTISVYRVEMRKCNELIQ